MTNKTLTPADMARLSHKAVQAKYGNDHYRKMQKASVEAKRLKKLQALQDNEVK